MEEKEVKMNVVRSEKSQGNKNDGKSQKLTYEQLDNACSQLYQQNQNLIRQIRQIDQVNMFKRLDYLFMVLKYESAFKDADFVNSCIDEIKEAMTIPAPEETKEEKK